MEAQERKELVQELQSKEVLLRDLKDYGPFKEFIAIFKDNADYADGSWHNIKTQEDDLFVDLKTRKLAYLEVISFIDNLEFTVEKLKEELDSIEE